MHATNGSRELPGRGRAAARETVAGTAADLARGVGGGLFVGLPLLMTLEMWRSGASMPAWKLLLFFVLNIGVLVILEYYSGFREEETWGDVVEDAVVALGIGLVLSALLLFALSAVGPGMTAREVVGKIALEAIPISIGASVAISLLGDGSRVSEVKKREAGFWGSQAVALAGALVFGFNIGPTTEPVLLGLRMQWWHVLLLLLLSLLQVHALVYAVDFRGTHEIPKGKTWWEVFLQESMTSYAVAVALAAYLLWTFGRIGPDTGWTEAIHIIVTLSFVTSLGAAAGKLIL